MRGLFTKIFLGFWIAQSLTFVISTMLILRHHFVRPSEMMEVLNSTLPSTVAAAVNAYETAGCSGLRQYAESIHQTIYLADTPNHLLCGIALSSAAAAALTAADKEPGVHANLAGELLPVEHSDTIRGRPPLPFPAEPSADRQHHLGCAIFFISRFPSSR